MELEGRVAKGVREGGKGGRMGPEVDGSLEGAHTCTVPGNLLAASTDLFKWDAARIRTAGLAADLF